MSSKSDISLAERFANLKTSPGCALNYGFPYEHSSIIEGYVYKLKSSEFGVEEILKLLTHLSCLELRLLEDIDSMNRDMLAMEEHIRELQMKNNELNSIVSFLSSKVQSNGNTQAAAWS